MVKLDIKCKNYEIKRAKYFSNAGDGSAKVGVPKEISSKNVYAIPLPYDKKEVITEDGLQIYSNFVIQRLKRKRGSSNAIFIPVDFVGADILLLPINSEITMDIFTDNYILKKANDNNVTARVDFPAEWYDQVVTSVPYIPLENNKIIVKYMQTRLVYNNIKYCSTYLPKKYINKNIFNFIDDLESY